jgi:hypothetical protein
MMRMTTCARRIAVVAMRMPEACSTLGEGLMQRC